MTALLDRPVGSPDGDTLLFARARDGDTVALEALLRTHREAVLAVCRRRLRNAADRDDAVQETMLRTVRSLHTVEDAAKLRSWMCRVAERVCLDQIRRDGRPVIEETARLSDDEPETLALRREDARLVREQLQQLGERQAMALWMRDAMGEDVPAVAARLGVTEGSARVLLSRARKQLRERWAQVAALLPAFKAPAVFTKIASLSPIAAATVLTPVIAAIVIGGAMAPDAAAPKAAPPTVAPANPSPAAAPATTIVPDLPEPAGQPSDTGAQAATPTGAPAPEPSGDTPAAAPAGDPAAPRAEVSTGGHVVGVTADDGGANQSDDEVRILADPDEDGSLLGVHASPEGMTGGNLPMSLEVPLPDAVDGL